MFSAALDNLLGRATRPPSSQPRLLGRHTRLLSVWTIRWTSSIQYALLGLIVLFGSRAARGDVIQDIIDEYQRKYDQIETILVQVSRTVVPLIDEADWFRRNGTVPGMTSTSTVVYHRDGRVYVNERSPWRVISRTVMNRLSELDPELQRNPAKFLEADFTQVKEIANRAWSEARETAMGKIQVYDGKKLLVTSGLRLSSSGIDRDAFTVKDIDALKRHYFPVTVLDELLFSFEIPGMPSEAEYRSGNFVPSLFSQSGYAEPERPVTAGDGDSVVLVAQNQDRIIFSSDFAFAIKRREWRTANGLIYDMNASQFEEIGKGIWIPREIEYTQYEPKTDAGGGDASIPLHRVQCRIEKIEINLPEHLEYFHLKIPAGSWVIDKNLQADDGDRSVSYIQPADPADLERAIQEAKKPLTSSPEVNRTPILIFWINVIIFGCILIAYFIMRKRS